MNDLLSLTSLPNLHPAFVHFPIVLLPVALLFEAAGLVRRGVRWPAHAAAVLYAAAAVAALAALWTGERAADGLVDVPATMQPYIAEHSDWAHYTAWTLGILAVLRIGLALWERRRPRAGLRAVALAGALAGMALLAVTADHGGALVFRHAVAVSLPAAEVEPTLPPPAANADSGAASRLVRAEDGTLRWQPLPADTEALGEVLAPAAGFSADAVTATASAGLELAVSGRTLLVLPGDFGDVQVDATLELGTFKGTLGLGHHVRDASNVGLFIVSTSGQARLVDRRDGAEKVLGEGAVELGEERLEIAVSSAGSHLKGLLGGRTVSHGHIDAPPQGACGLFFDGNGTVRLVVLAVTPLERH